MPLSRRFFVRGGIAAALALNVAPLCAARADKPAVQPPRVVAARPIAVIGITSETKVLLYRMTGTKATSLMGVGFVTGKLSGTPIVLVRCGVGKVNAALATTLLLDRYHPAGVIFSGSAGALNVSLGPGDIVIGSRTTQHDVGTVTADGMQHEAVAMGMGKKHPQFYAADARLLISADAAARATVLQPVDIDGVMRSPRILTGTIVTGDVFVADQKLNDELRTKLGADAVEEEGAAVAQVCHITGTPFLAVRSVSDNANGDTPKNYRRFYLLASENSARLVTGIVTRAAPALRLPALPTAAAATAQVSAP